MELQTWVLRGVTGNGHCGLGLECLHGEGAAALASFTPGSVRAGVSPTHAGEKGRSPLGRCVRVFQNNNRTYIKKENNLRNWVTQLRGYQVQPARQAGRLGTWRSQHPDSEATMWEEPMLQIMSLGSCWGVPTPGVLVFLGLQLSG